MSKTVSMGGAGQGDGRPTQQMNIPWEKTTTMACEECGCTFFNDVTHIRILSKFASGAPNDLMIPAKVPMCVECKHVNKEFMDEFSNIKT